MVKAQWMKKHEETMAEEAKKNKLLSENEALETQKRELVATIKELRREVSVHGGDYETITKERIVEVNQLDEKFVDLKLKKEQLEQGSIKESTKVNNLRNSVDSLEQDINKKEDYKHLLNIELTALRTQIETMRLIKQDYEDDKRSQLKKITDELNLAKKELFEIRKEYKEKMEAIQKETRLLSIRRNDLEIYESRMRKKYPNEKFILK